MRKSLLVATFLALLLSLSIQFPIFPIYIVKAQEGETWHILEVNGYENTTNRGNPMWGVEGTTPYLNSINYAGGQLATGAYPRTSGNFTFEDLPAGTENITSVIGWFYIIVWETAGASTAIAGAHIHNGTMWDYDYYDYQITFTKAMGWHYNFTDLMDTPTLANADLSMINNLEMCFTAYSATGTGANIDFDYFFLNVTADAPYVPPPYDRAAGYNIRYILGLIGLAMIIIAPTYSIWEIKKNKNYLAIITAFVLAAIGYAFVVVWLVP